MKNIFSSPPEDLQEFLKEIRIIQKQLIDLRVDHDQMNRKLTTLVKGVAILVSQPEEEIPEYHELEDK